ncbi:alpha/beta hydrolase family protein [Faecalibacter bovis]|uniref:S9 family peptidase n=1 Tax=Faecalibacter bovis TaxID=2898187 RepID=A0ABX7XFF1_9FLAO|nr:prolyl oligopeptidase family serine peptidase [Faecalibacter bovis]QTV06593.1 S9 family peptidase [Faecalibacter bovis]
MKKIIYSLMFLAMTFGSALNAQENLSFQTPPKEILQLADADMPPSISVDGKAENAFLSYRSRYKTLNELAETELRLAGLRINPVTNINSRENFSEKITFYDLKNSKEQTITGLPAKGRFSNQSWNSNQTKYAVTNTTEKGVELWVIDVKSKSATKVYEDKLNANLGRPYTWLSDNKTVIVNVIPASKKALINTAEAVPTGPTVSNADGKEAQNRTYQDLLKDKNDEFNFEQLAISELVKVDVETGAKTKWKDAAMYANVVGSPDGQYVLVNEIQKPFSYLVTYRSFPSVDVVYDVNGKVVKEINKKDLQEVVPKGFSSTTTGKRSVYWRADKANTLYWVEALDGGDANKPAEYRDAVYQLAAPFTGEKQELVKVKDRYRGIIWGNDEVALVRDSWYNTRNESYYIFNPSNNKQEAKRFFSRNTQDAYNDPGTFVTEKNDYGYNVLAINKGKLMLDGEGISPDGILPFVDEFDIKTLKTTRLWRAQKSDKLETIVDIIDPKKGIVLERIQSKTEYPNLYVRNIFQKGGKPKQITFTKNPFEAMNQVSKELINYKRADGVELSGTLYLPPNYDKTKKEKLPMLMWAYPREFKDAATAGQVTTSENQFTSPSYGGPVFWALRGYAVLDNAAFPIIGEGKEEPNDTFVPQLVANAKAAIDAVDALGFIDRERVAVGGHSYGAFMTANLLSHSNLFAAGIARSGAYNRTLTPFGFQSEQRNYWEAPEVYNTMSPFMNAEKMKTPLLLIHGDADNNTGTFPMQSERYFNALKGLGATTRLVLLPKESHGYASRENIMHMLWEQDQWLEKYVKNKGKETSKEVKKK